jgi:hypothetical protein
MAEATTGKTTHRACACTVLTTLSDTSENIFILVFWAARTFKFVPRSLGGISGQRVSRTVKVVTLFTE